MSNYLATVFHGDVTLEQGSDVTEFGWGDLNVNRKCLIFGTENSTSATSGTLIVNGGSTFNKDVFVGGIINVNGNNIINVATPVNGLDAVNKDYVDTLIDIASTSTNSFTTGQLLIASSTGSIVGYNNLLFGNDRLSLNNTNLYIANTNDASGLGSGGSLTSFGGASFAKSVYVGGQLDVNQQRITRVQMPEDPYDAVNKLYVNSLISSLSTPEDNLGNNQYEQTFILENNVSTPQDIPNFTFTSNVKAFISYIYVKNSETTACSIYTLRGNKSGSRWNIVVSYVGDRPFVKFTMRVSNSSTSIIQYTNENISGITSIKFRTVTQIIDQSASQFNIKLDNNTSIYKDISNLIYPNDSIDAVNIVIHLSNNLNDQNSLFFLNCVQKNGEWVFKSFYTGDYSNNIYFNVLSGGTIGKIQYINKNTNGSYTARIQQLAIEKSQTSVLLEEQTLNFIPIPTQDFIFTTEISNFNMLIYVSIEEESKYALYEINGYNNNGIWKLNSVYIGDKTGVVFNIYTNTDGNGFLQYTNTSNYGAVIRYIINTPIPYEPLQVGNGGTGSQTFSNHGILRGNGTNPVIASADFIYKNFTLELGDTSKAILFNTASAVSLTNAPFVVHGGASINKNLLVGTSVVVKNIDITPNTGDIVAEKVFNASNNQTFPANVIGFSFFNVNIKSFSGFVCVTIATSDGDELNTLYTLKGLKKKTGWILESTSFGDLEEVQFSVATNGQIQYVSSNIQNWASTVMKFRALTTSYP